MKSASIIAAAIAFAMLAPAARAADETSSGSNGTPISCLSYLSQFEGAVIYHPGAPHLKQAQTLADKGRTLCNQGDEKTASAYLMVAIRELGVTPKGTREAAPVTIMQNAERPLPQSGPDLY